MHYKSNNFTVDNATTQQQMRAAVKQEHDNKIVFLGSEIMHLFKDMYDI